MPKFSHWHEICLELREVDFSPEASRFGDNGKDWFMKLIGSWSMAVLGLLGAVVLVALGSGSAAADGFTVTITVDENGNGGFINSNGFSANLLSSMQPDSGPGGLSSVLTYDLLNPPGLVSGDLRIDEPGGLFGDDVRFNANQAYPGGGTGVLVFYSNPVDGFDSLADTISPPGAFYDNTVDLLEGADGELIYTPTSGQPGFVAGAGGPVTYVLISDPATPEPASLALLGAGLAALGAARRRKA